MYNEETYFDKPKETPAQCGKRDWTKPNHWEKIDINKDGIITKPTILCFGGNRTFDPKDANAVCRAAEELLSKDEYAKKISKNDYDLIGFCYGHYPLKDQTEVSRLDDVEVENIEKNLIQPLYLDSKGNRLNIQKAIKNFNMLTVLCHSYGAVAFDKIMKKTFSTMVEKGYSLVEIGDILSQVVCVSYAPKCMIRGVSSIQIISGCDSFDIPKDAPKKMRNTFYSHFYNLFEEEKLWGNGTQIANGNTIGVYTTNMTNNETTNDHPLKILINGGKENASENSKNAKTIFEVAQQTLALSLKNSIENVKSKVFYSKPTINQLYTKTKTILGKKQIDLDMEM